MQKIWSAIKPYSFSETYGAFIGFDVRGEDVKGRILESMKIQTRHSGHNSHPLLSEALFN